MKTQDDLLGIILLRQAALTRNIELQKKERDFPTNSQAYRRSCQHFIDVADIEYDSLDALAMIITDSRPMDILLETNYCKGT